MIVTVLHVSFFSGARSVVSVCRRTLGVGGLEKCRVVLRRVGGWSKNTIVALFIIVICEVEDTVRTVHSSRCSLSLPSQRAPCVDHYRGSPAKTAQPIEVPAARVWTQAGPKNRV